MTLQYCPAPLTGFKDLKKLEPAHYLFIDLKTKKIEKERYWKLDYSQKLNLSEDEWKRRIMEKLEECVRLRMISDVPLGAFLSGGIDSSAVVGVMSKLSNKPVKTFSIGFEEEKYNELPYARMIAKKFKTEHTEFIVKPNAIEMLPMLVKQYEEPYADSSALPTYYVSKMTRDYVTVALNGDGGDENFAGYPWYSIHKFSLWYENFLPLHRALVLPVARFLAKKIKHRFLDRAYRFANFISENYAKRYLNYICYFPNEMKSGIYTEEFKKKVWHENTYDIIINKFKEAGNIKKSEQPLFVDFNTYLPDDLLAKVDIDSMAVSLEGRSPLLDHEFMELTAKIPFNLKLKGMNNKKYIYKKVLEGFIPNEILYRKKMGFVVPISDWFKNDLKKYATDILLSEKATARNLFKKEEIKKILDMHTSTEINYASKIWALLTLELWFREYFDSPR